MKTNVFVVLIALFALGAVPWLADPPPSADSDQILIEEESKTINIADTGDIIGLHGASTLTALRCAPDTELSTTLSFDNDAPKNETAAIAERLRRCGDTCIVFSDLADAVYLKDDATSNLWPGGFRLCASSTMENDTLRQLA